VEWQCHALYVMWNDIMLWHMEWQCHATYVMWNVHMLYRPLTWFLILLRWGVLHTTLCNKVCQWLAAGMWFTLGTPVSSTNKTDIHDIQNVTEILLKVALNTTTLTLPKSSLSHDLKKIKLEIWFSVD
jgi:hypothetical protein